MALVVADRVQETTTTSGTGTFNLVGAVAGFKTFVSGIGTTNTTYYAAYDQTAQVWEVGLGTVTSGSPDTLSRDTILSNSSGTTAKISFAGNTTYVWCDYPASKGLYLDASNQLNLTNASGYNIYASGAAANYFAGKVGIGSVPISTATMNIASNMTGATVVYGLANYGVAQSDVTANAVYFDANPSTAATSFTLTGVSGYRCAQGTFGAGSTVTNQYGFNANNTLTGATNNYGFYSNIASGSNRWNFYAAGTASNYFGGPIGINSTALTGYNLRVGGSVTGATTGWGAASINTGQSDVTSNFGAYYSQPSTQATAYTLSNLYHYNATQGTIGAGSTVTNQYSFFVNSANTGATNNYGFYSNIASGTGRYNFYASGSADNYFAGNTTIGGSSTLGSGSANYQQVAGAATTLTPIHSVAGSDTNIPLAFVSKGTGGIDLAPGSAGVNISNGRTVTAITRTAAGSGYTSLPSFSITAPTTPGGVQAVITGTLIAVTQAITSGGTGYTVGNTLTVSGGTGTAATYTVTTVSSGVITAIAYATGGSYTVPPTNPVSVTGGTGSGATLTLGFGIHPTFTITNAGSGYLEQPTVSFSGGGGSGAAAYATVGSGTKVQSLGSTMSFYTPGGEGFRVLDPGPSTANYVQTQGSSSGNQPFLWVGGSNPNIALGISSKGTGGLNFFTNSGGQNQLSISHTASAVNYVQVTGGATTVRPALTAQGSDTNIGLSFSAKGAGNIMFFQSGSTTSGTSQTFGILTGGNANYLTVSPTNTGVGPALSALGTDTNINLALTPKGTGTVQFGTYTASVLSPTGYITITDSGGTTRRLLVG